MNLSDESAEAAKKKIHVLYLDGTDPEHPLPPVLQWLLVALSFFWIILGLFSNPEDWNINVNLLLGAGLLLFVIIFKYASKPDYLSFDNAQLQIRVDRADPVTYKWESISSVREIDRTLIIELSDGEAIRLDLNRVPSHQFDTELPRLLKQAS